LKELGKKAEKENRMDKETECRSKVVNYFTKSVCPTCEYMVRCFADQKVAENIIAPIESYGTVVDFIKELELKYGKNVGYFGECAGVCSVLLKESLLGDADTVEKEISILMKEIDRLEKKNK
jgi:hypothetical protein